MRLADVGLRQMRHLMHRDPVIAEFRFGHLAADKEPDCGAPETPRRAALHVATGGGTIRMRAEETGNLPK
jgi:hypothetical protein